MAARSTRFTPRSKSALKQSLRAHHILPGIYATGAQVVVLEGGYQLHADTDRRLNDAVSTLVAKALHEISPICYEFNSFLRTFCAGWRPF